MFFQMVSFIFHVSKKSVLWGETTPVITNILKIFNFHKQSQTIDFKQQQQFLIEES